MICYNLVDIRTYTVCLKLCGVILSKYSQWNRIKSSFRPWHTCLGISPPYNRHWNWRCSHQTGHQPRASPRGEASFVFTVSWFMGFMGFQLASLLETLAEEYNPNRVAGLVWHRNKCLVQDIDLSNGTLNFETWFIKRFFKSTISSKMYHVVST